MKRATCGLAIWLPLRGGDNFWLKEGFAWYFQYFQYFGTFGGMDQQFLVDQMCLALNDDSLESSWSLDRDVNTPVEVFTFSIWEFEIHWRWFLLCAFRNRTKVNCNFIEFHTYVTLKILNRFEYNIWNFKYVKLLQTKKIRNFCVENEEKSRFITFIQTIRSVPMGQSSSHKTLDRRIEQKQKRQKIESKRKWNGKTNGRFIEIILVFMFVHMPNGWLFLCKWVKQSTVLCRH